MPPQPPFHTEVLFVNHSSVLIRYGEEYLLCDPWYRKPAFGSWLPIPPMFVHPAYLAALKDKLRILVSHGHDDHCDDTLLPLFGKQTEIYSSDYASPSVKNRMKRLGFGNYVDVTREGVQAGAFTIKSYRNEDLSLDDALYTIRTPDALIVHCNDCWEALTDDILESVEKDVAEAGGERTLYMSQTNSASGFPMSYVDFSPEEKRRLLQRKVDKMIITGINNAATLGTRYFHSYAGFAGVFVKGHPEYLEDSLMPTPDYVKSRYADHIPDEVEIVDFKPGDIFDFSLPGVRKSFFGNDIADEDIKQTAIDYYERYKAIGECDSYRPAGTLDKAEVMAKLMFFLSEFNKFVVDKSVRSEFHTTLIGKIFTVEVTDLNLTASVRFGFGLVTTHKNYNKKLIVESPALMRVIHGESLFENLYTGYNAQFSRNPANEYNRDIVMYMVMFSYVYQNVVVKRLPEGIPVVIPEPVESGIRP